MSEETTAEVEKQVTPPPAGATEQPASSTFTQEQVNKVAGTAREEGRKSAEHGWLEKLQVKSFDELTSILDQHRKSEADKLSELEKVQKENANTLAKLQEIEKENQTLKTKGLFDEAVTELSLKFVNAKAAADAFGLLDASIVTDETKGIKAAVKQLFEERPYLFDKPVAPEIDAKKKNTKSGEMPTDKVEDLKKRFKL